MEKFAQTNYETLSQEIIFFLMLYPRLVLAQQLISSEEVIFCSIDEKNQYYLKRLFDEIFSEKNTDQII